MTDQTAADLLEVGEVHGVTVVRFTRRSILDPMLIELIGQRLKALVHEGSCRRLVLNFSRVESVTSAMLGKLVSLYTAVGAAGGRLVFAGVDPFLQQIFRVCNFPSDIPVHASEADAVQSLAEGRPRGRNQGSLISPFAAVLHFVQPGKKWEHPGFGGGVFACDNTEIVCVPLVEK